MSQPNHEPSHRPIKDGKEFEPVSYHMAVGFHPGIKLTRKRGLEFAAALSGHFAAKGVQLEDHQWTFSQPLGSRVDSDFRIVVGSGHISLEADFPSDREEVWEHRYALILTEFGKTFRPELCLGSSVVMRAIIPIDGDARSFLSTYVTKFDVRRLQPLGRPVHGFGIRLFMPAFQKMATESQSKGKGKKQQKTETIDWTVDVKAESLIEDPSKLFIEAQASWQVPRKWGASTVDELVSKLAVVGDFLKSQFIPFLIAEDGDI